VDLEQLRGWLDLYGRAWEQADPDAVAELFTENATYRETPFSEVMEGREAIREYWRQIPETQRDIRFEADVVSVSPAAARWRTSYVKKRTDERVTLDGVFLLGFDAENRCSSLLEWWHADAEPAF
jgi:uncharacterized protein (TIGR02246 family)